MWEDIRLVIFPNTSQFALSTLDLFLMFENVVIFRVLGVFGIPSKSVYNGSVLKGQSHDIQYLLKTVINSRNDP